MKLKVLLGIGIALVCVGLVAMVSGGEIGCQQSQRTVEPARIDTEGEVILMATNWAKTTDCSDLAAHAAKVKVNHFGNLWQVCYYSKAKLIEEITHTPRTITYLDVIVSLYIEDGIIERYGYYI